MIKNLLLKISYDYLLILDIPFPLMLLYIQNNKALLVIFNELQILMFFIYDYENILLNKFNPFNVMFNNILLYLYLHLQLNFLFNVIHNLFFNQMLCL